jgi:phage-related protein
MTWSVTINETSLSDLSVYVVGVPAMLDGLGRSFPLFAIPGRQGSVLAGDPTVAPRQLRIECTINTTSIALRQAAERKLKALASRGIVTITVDDDVNPPLCIEGVNIECTATPKGHPVDAIVADVVLQFLCPDPTWRAVLGVTVGLNTTPTMIPLGNAPSGGVVRIAAPSWSANVQNPVLSYLNLARVTVQSMTFTTTLVAGEDFLEIDLDRGTVTKYDDAIATTGAPLLTSGDFFVLDPMDGDPINNGFPYLMLGSSAGTPTGQWVGFKRYA